MGSTRLRSRRLLLVAALVACPVTLSASVARAQGASIENATDQQKKDAQVQYERGARAYDAKRYEEAFTAFAASYAVVRSPNAHMMLARCLTSLGRNARAYNELVAVEKEAAGNPKYASTLERSKELRAEAAQKVVVLTIKLVGEAPGPVRVTVGDVLAPVETPYAVEPGKISVKAIVAEQPVDAKDVDGAAGQSHAVELKVGEIKPLKPMGPPTVAPPVGDPVVAPPVAPPPEKPAPEPSGTSTGLLVGGAAIGLLGLGGVGMGAAFYYTAVRELDYLEDPAASGCQPDGSRVRCPGHTEGRIEAGKDNQQAAGIAVGVGAALTAIGVGMMIGGGVLAGPPKNGRDSVSLRVGPGGAWLTGEF